MSGPDTGTHLAITGKFSSANKYKDGYVTGAGLRSMAAFINEALARYGSRGLKHRENIIEDPDGRVEIQFYFPDPEEGARITPDLTNLLAGHLR